MFKEMNFTRSNGLDMIAINKHIEHNFDDRNWRNVYQVVSEDCPRRLRPRLSEIQKKLEAAPYNIRMEDCDVQFMAYVVCINLESFLVCFYYRDIFESSTYFSFSLFSEMPQRLLDRE